MILRSKKTHTEFELRVLGYEFPEIAHAKYDSNWLLVNIRVDAPIGSWSATDPCLLTWEGHWLLNWLADITSTTERDREMRFLEANLSFVLADRRGEEVELNVECKDELRQPGTTSETATPGITLAISLSDLREAVTSFSRELRLFPIRAGAIKRCRPYSDPLNTCLLCAEAGR